MHIDLHSHSTASDGTLSPSELVRFAAAHGVETLAITDHDTVAGYDDLPEDLPLQLICGVEFSCLWQGRTIHVVGLNVDRGNHSLVRLVERQQAARLQRAHIIADRLCRLKLADSFDDVFARHSGAPGRPDFARALLARGAVADVQTAFKKYLGAGKRGDVKTLWPDLDTVIDSIRAAGGVAVLAHPSKYRLTRSKLTTLLSAFTRAGGEAIEVVCGHQDPATTRQLADLCVDFGLLASCGSDFHSEAQTWSRPGRFPDLPRRLTPVWSRWTRSSSTT
ncbi:MAG: PHP domain-containing protein [Pseudomonadota bacterium]